VTADGLSMKMTFKPEKIDKLMVSLVNKGYLLYDASSGKMRTSLDALKEKVYQTFQKSLERNQANLMSQERNDRISKLIAFFESKLNRTLSPLENQAIGEWLDSGYQDEEIENALLDSLAQNKKNLRFVDKVPSGQTGLLPTWRKKGLPELPQPGTKTSKRHWILPRKCGVPAAVAPSEVVLSYLKSRFPEAKCALVFHNEFECLCAIVYERSDD
jgi:DnaD/phage-associated family protein